MNGGCVENAMDSSSIFLSVLRFFSYLSFLFPLFCRLHWLDTVGPAYVLSIPIIHWIAFGCPTHFWDLILTLFYCSFSMVFRSARPHSLWYAYSIVSYETLRYFNSMRRMGLRSGYGSLTRNKITRSGFAWGGLTYDHSSIIEVQNFSVPLVGWAHFFAFSSHDLRIGSSNLSYLLIIIMGQV